MDERTLLLNQLHVDRSEPAKRSDRRWWIAIALFVVVLAGGVWAASRSRVRAAEGEASLAVPVPAVAAASSGRTAALDASGYIVPRRVATVSAKSTGRVIDLLVEEGQRVTKGQILAHLDDSNTRAYVAQATAQVGEAEANLHAARVSLQDSEPTYKRSETMHRQGLASDDVFDASRAVHNAATARFSVAERAAAVARANAAVAQQNQDDTVVRAPFSGVVTVKAAQPGDMVSPVSAGGGFTRTGICTIVDMQSLALDVDISEKFISRIRAGQPATVTLNAYPDWNIPAKVLAVIPTADRAKATVRVRIGLETSDPRILPEMGARVSVKE
jgi:RND family efflux transporter MFP subunit